MDAHSERNAILFLELVINSNKRNAQNMVAKSKCSEKTENEMSRLRVIWNKRTDEIADAAVGDIITPNCHYLFIEFVFGKMPSAQLFDIGANANDMKQIERKATS